jgi:hypothetical protein
MAETSKSSKKGGAKPAPPTPNALSSDLSSSSSSSSSTSTVLDAYADQQTLLKLKARAQAATTWQEKLTAFKEMTSLSIKLKLRTGLVDKQVAAWDLVHLGKDKHKIFVPTMLDCENWLTQCVLKLVFFLESKGILTTEGLVTGDEESELGREASLVLMGIIDATDSAPPKSFAHSADPMDIVRIAMWKYACAVFASNPLRKDAHSKLGRLPDLSVGKMGAGKYLTTRLVKLGAATSELVHKKFTLLHTLISLWAQQQDCFTLLATQKISWTDLLHASAPMTTKKSGKSLIRVTKTPFKPTRSPWLHRDEKKFLDALINPTWKMISDIKTEWNDLDAIAQHSKYNLFSRRITDLYARLFQISSDMNGKLGRRKEPMIRSLTELGLIPKKKDLVPNKISGLFWKNLDKVADKCDFRLKLVFHPKVVTHVVETSNALPSVPVAAEQKEHSIPVVSMDLSLDSWHKWFVQHFKISECPKPSALPTVEVILSNMFAGLDQRSEEVSKTSSSKSSSAH